MLTVGVVGVGHIGSVIAAELAMRGAKVIAIDTDFKKINAVQNGKSPISEPGLDELIASAVESGRLIASTDINLLANIDAVVITVGTPIIQGNADLSTLKTAVAAIVSVLKNETLIIIKSTVPPGTTRDIVGPILQGNHRLAFVPERLAEGQAIADFRALPVVVGGVDSQSTVEISEFWHQLGFEVISVRDSTAAELVKLADNAWIDLNIAFGHELAQICDVIDTDVLEVIQAANTLAKGSSFVNILLPSVGVGGYCLTKDPHFLADFAASKKVDIKLSRIGREINENSPNYLYLQLEKSLVGLSGKKILCVGISFKNNSGDVRFSPAIEFMKILESNSIEYVWLDPLVFEDDVPQTLKDCRIKEILPEEKYDVIAVLAAHTSFGILNYATLAPSLKPKGTIVDGRRFFTSDEIKEFTENGIQYVGVGRA